MSLRRRDLRLSRLRVGVSVVGIDACQRGWIAIELRDDVTGHFADKLEPVRSRP